LPLESFAELAFEARLMARDKASAAESCELLIATFEAKGEIDRGDGTPARPPRPLELLGMRDAAAELRHRARMAGRVAEAMDALAAREAEVRALVASDQTERAVAS
jgi:hypothetical protein